MIVTTDTRYGHIVRLEQLDGPVIRLLIDASASISGQTADAHLNVDQARVLAGGLDRWLTVCGEREPHPSDPDRTVICNNDRGLATWVDSPTITGPHIRLDQSSSAMEPCCWLRITEGFQADLAAVHARTLLTGLLEWLEWTGE